MGKLRQGDSEDSPIRHRRGRAVKPPGAFALATVRTPTLVSLKATGVPGYHGHPVITVMTPVELEDPRGGKEGESDPISYVFWAGPKPEDFVTPKVRGEQD
jgi:hypothetical protein